MKSMMIKLADYEEELASINKELALLPEGRLSKKGSLYYQVTNEKKSGITKNKKISPVEVKSSSYREHSSLDKFRRKFSSKLGDAYILYQKDVLVKDGVFHFPLYMAILL